jgi:CHASE1-domain containing sensor protein
LPAPGDDAQHVIGRESNPTSRCFTDSGRCSPGQARSPRGFHSYVAALDLTHRYPGFQSLSYVEYVTRDAKAGFEARVRRDTSLERGYPGHTIWPAGDRPDYFVVSYIDPMGK